MLFFQRVLFLSYALVVASSSCSSVLDADCSKEIKEGKAACVKCAEAHEADLKAANCTVKIVEELCSSPGPAPAPGPGPGPGPAPATAASQEPNKGPCLS